MTQQFLTWNGLNRVKTALLVVLSLAGVAAGCGESSLQSVTPIGPSPISSPSQLAGATDVPLGNQRVGILHTFDGAVEDDEDSDVDSDDDADSDEDSDRDDVVEAEVEGRIATVSGSCQTGTRSFTVTVGLSNVTVRTSAATVYRDGVCNGLQVGARVEVKGRQALDGSIDATRIEFEEVEHNNEAEIEGRIAAVSGSCQTGMRSFTVTVGLSNVTVRTSAATVYRDGVCNGLQVGARVEVKGRRALDGSIDATRIEFEDSDDEDSDD